MKVVGVLLLCCLTALCGGRPADDQSPAAPLVHIDKKQCPCAVKKMIESVKEQHASKRSVHKVYAFSAEMGQEREINDDITVVFSKTLSNFGNLYSPAYGQFVCVDDAVYVFLWSTINMKGTKYRNTFVLERTGQDIKYGPKTSGHSKTSGVSTMLAVTSCRSNPSAAISVRTETQATYADHYSSFSGFRLASTRYAVAFTAELTNNVRVFPDQRIRFDRVLQNYGGAYDPTHGYFRCPDDGVYAFFVSTQGPYDSKAQWSISMLMKDDEPVMNGPETYRAIGSADSGVASTIATIQCDAGSDIYVNSNQSHKFDYNYYGAVLTTFSGFKLFNPYSSAAVAFTAVLSRDHIYHTEARTLVFDKVITNVGEAYYPLVGFFICPDSEVYLFSWTGESNIGGSRLDLHVDGVPVKANTFTIQSSNVNYGNSGSSAMAVILRCSPNVRVEVVSPAGTIKNTEYLAGFTSFSGFKIPSDYYD